MPQYAFLIGKPGVPQYESGNKITGKFVRNSYAKTGCAVIFRRFHRAGVVN